MKTKKLKKRDASKKKQTNTVANAAVGAVVGGVIAGPVGAIAGAAVGAMVEKGPVKPQPRKPPTRELTADDPPSAPGKRRPPANRKKPAGKGSRRKPGVTIAPPLAGAGPDVRISRRQHNSKPSAKRGATRA
jgi:hypothetical protein